ncbi:hypothetical protein [Anaeromyxobacter dehalogenans]|uniref:hypothetical protein n=1 Tax=Anaeromyxobacter dehalogenans TaxID=161493 RepID=UPI0012EE2816|nr:hypothetical protein [Anaeromyxobacter dehalogenans]
MKPLAVTSVASISTGALTYAACAADEIAVLVGDSVARQRLGSETREALNFWANRPRSAPAVAGGSVRAFVAAPGVNGDGLEAAGTTVLNTTAVDETKVGVIVGAMAAACLDKSSLLHASIAMALDQFVSRFGV